MRKKIIISGSSGLIGSKLTTFFKQQGHTVHRLIRKKEKENENDLDIYWNYETGEIDSAQLEGMDVAIHLAGKPLDGQRWTPEIKERIYSSRIKGTTFISETFAKLNKQPRLLISASATDFYAESDTEIGENDGLPGKGFVAEMCQDWESATEPARRAGIRVVNIRIPTVLASDGHGILTTLLPLFKRGLGPILGTGKQLMCFIARDDMVRAIEHIIENEALVGPVNVLAPETVTFEEFARVLGKILHRPVFMKIPPFILRLAMGEVAEMVLEGDTHLRPEKLLKAGFQFDFPDIESALRHELSL